MALPVVSVTCGPFYDQAGNAIVGKRILAQLSTVEEYQGYVVPSLVEATTGATGTAVLSLFPNELGANGSEYKFIIPAGTKGAVTLRGVVPNSDCALHEVVGLPPYAASSNYEVFRTEVYAARDDTEASASNAAFSEAAAAASASNAGTSEANAAASEAAAEGFSLSAFADAGTATDAAAAALASSTLAQGDADTAVGASIAAEAALGLAEDARDDAQVFSLSASGSASNAADSEAAAEAARAAAVVAQGAAETAQDAAVAARDTATELAGIATTKAMEADQSATDAEEARAAAVVAKDAAEAAMAGKADVVAGAVAGHLAALDAGGNLTDSGFDAGATLQNILTNTGGLGLVCSQADANPANVGSELTQAVTWTNEVGATYETLTSSGRLITSAINSSGYGLVDSSPVTVVSGRLYRLILNLGLNSGTAPNLYIGSGIGGGGTLSVTNLPLVNGTNDITFEAASSAIILCLYTNNNVATNFALSSWSLYEVTPAFTGADTKAPDGWLKESGLKLYRTSYGDITHVRGGQDGLEIEPSSAAAKLYYQALPAGKQEMFRGKAGCIGAYVYCAKASQIRPAIKVSGAWQYGNWNTTSGALEWLELAYTCSAGEVVEAMGWQVAADATPTTAHLYLSPVMGIKGSAIGEGNYRPKGNEIIYFPAQVTSSSLNWTFFSNLSGTNFSIATDTKGAIPRNVKAILGQLQAYDTQSASYDGILISLGDAAGQSSFLVADVSRRTNGINGNVITNPSWCPMDSSGLARKSITASGTGTFRVQLTYLGVQL